MNKENLLVLGDPLQNAVDQMVENVLPNAEYAALMADHHVGYDMPIGGVAAFKNTVYPSYVGFDIGCGNRAVKLDLKIDEVDVPSVMDQIWDKIDFGIGQKSESTTSKEQRSRLLMSSPLWDTNPLCAGLKDLAYSQLGTVGSGNHYVDLFHDEEGFVWIGVHFGSRGFGHKVTTAILKEGTAFDIESEMGKHYLNAMALAGNYAFTGRAIVTDLVEEILGLPKQLDVVNNHHNYAWMEEHNGEYYLVIRKGATPLWVGGQSFIGGSMGDNSYIVTGKESRQFNATLRSTVHGAGRMISRTAATGRSKWGKVKGPGLVSPEDMKTWIQEKGVCLRGGGVDESPHCYKRIDEVLAYHSESLDICKTLTPVGVAMAGPEHFDPYKD